jgi:hypothetical protein
MNALSPSQAVAVLKVDGGAMLLKQQAWLRQKLLVLGSLAVGSLLYLVARVGSLDRWVTKHMQNPCDFIVS